MTTARELCNYRNRLVQIKERAEKSLKTAKSNWKIYDCKYDLKVLIPLIDFLNTEIERLQLIDFEAAKKALEDLHAQGHTDLAVYVNAGWGGQEPDVTITSDGNGQKPLFTTTLDACDRLIKAKIVGGNNLITYKARRNHPYLVPGDKTERMDLGTSLYRQVNPVPY